MWQPRVCGLFEMYTKIEKGKNVWIVFHTHSYVFFVLIFLLFINFDILDILALVDVVDSCVFRASLSRYFYHT